MKMKNYFKPLCVAALIVVAMSSSFAQNRIVDTYGRLSIKGNHIFSEHGDTVQLRGMSLFWSQWMDQYYNKDAVKWLRDDWKSTVVRAAMGVEMGGYDEYPEAEKQKVFNVVDAAIELGMYVIIDYHTHEGHKNTQQAVDFFAEMAKKYGKYPNVLYEIYNEPLKDADWSADIKPYSEKVIAAIRKHDPDNIIIVGTRQWSQLVNEAASDQIKGTNIAYTLHFYAATHGKWLRDEAEKAMKQGVCIFVTEYGSCDASGNGRFDPKHTNDWFKWMDKHRISYCNWSVADKEETASVLLPGASGKGGWKDSDLTESGKFIKADLVSKNTPILESANKKAKKK
jgi:endoglucanase